MTLGLEGLILRIIIPVRRKYHSDYLMSEDEQVIDLTSTKKRKREEMEQSKLVWIGDVFLIHRLELAVLFVWNIVITVEIIKGYV